MRFPYAKSQICDELPHHEQQRQHSYHHSSPNGGKPAARKTAGRYCGQTDDPACLGARNGS
jgi:hypothetical protein